MQSLKNKTSELNVILNELNIHCALITEHWVTNNELFPLIDKYNPLSTFKRKQFKHGGQLF